MKQLKRMAAAAADNTTSTTTINELQNVSDSESEAEMTTGDNINGNEMKKVKMNPEIEINGVA